MEIPGSSNNKGKYVSRRRQRISASERIDYISRLPEVILLHILSFLSLKDSIIVSCTSRQWKYLWTKLSNLNLDKLDLIKITTRRDTSCLLHGNYPRDIDSIQRPHYSVYAAKRKFVNLMDQLVMHHSGCTINNFRLSFDYAPHDGYTRRIDNWVRFALRTNINELELNLRDVELYCFLKLVMEPKISSIPYYWPSGCFAPKLLKSMILTFCKFGAAATFGFFRVLQKLSLHQSVVEDFTIGELASNCPALEDLSLENCVVHKDFLVSKEDIMIRRLSLLNYHTCGSSKLCINMSTPYLSTLMIVGRYLVLSSIKNAIHLVDVAIAIKEIHVQGDALGALLHDLNHCRTLKLSTQCIQVASREGDSPQQKPLPLQNLKILIIAVGLAAQEFPKISRLLRDSLNLECLALDMVLPRDNWSYWELNTLSCRCLQNCLKKIYVRGFVGRSYQVHLLHFLLENARVLEKMVIITVTNSRYQTDDMANQNLLNFPRASPQAKVEILPDPRLNNI